ncbi:MAG: GtrA family protein [Bacteroidales bacterium]|nr:GtrA family protein [Bacteroidales bacterium]
MISAFYQRNKALVVQLLRYAVVGGVAFVVDYGSLWLLTEVVGLHHLVSAAIAFILGLICNYVISTAWVFGESKVSNRWVEFVIFSIIGVIGLGLNELIIYLCTDVCGLHYMLSKIISTVIIFFWNFFARRFILFKS